MDGTNSNDIVVDNYSLASYYVEMYFGEKKLANATCFFSQQNGKVYIYIDSELFKDNARYMRDALVAASAIFSDLGDRRKPEYLYRIVGDALERGKETEEDAVRRIRSAGYPATEQQVRKVIFWDRKERRIHGADEIGRLLKQKEREELGLER